MARSKSTSAAESASGSKKRRGRQNNVRGLILSMLADGPMASPALVSKGGFSPAAAFLNLKSLKKEGVISAARQGRQVLFSLVDGAGAAAAAAAPAAPRRRGRPPRSAAAAPKAAAKSAPSTLRSALDSLSRRLSPVAALEDKLHVLAQLAGTLPPSIARLLGEIGADLKRMSN